MSAPAERGGDAHRYLIALAVVLASLMQVIDTSIVNVAIPHMMGELGAGIDEIAWVSTGYILASVIVMPMTGWLSAYFGRKRYFAASIIIFTAASFLCGASGSLPELILWRIVQGVGGGALLTTSQAILYEVFPPEEIGMAMALFGLGIMVGPTLGPTLGGWLTDRYSWPWIFYINLPIGIIAVMMVIAYIHDAEHHVKAKSIDFLGIALLTVSIAAMQYVLEHGQREDWFDSGLIVALSVTAMLGSVTLVWRELTVAEPVVDFRVLRNREMAVGTIVGVFFGVGLLGSVFVLPIFLQGMLHFTAMQTGILIFPGAIATAVSMTLIGRVSHRIDARPVIGAGGVCFAIAMWQLSKLTAEAGAHDFFWPLLLRGIGLGMMWVPLTTLTLSTLEPKQIGAGAALSNFFRQLGGSFGIAAMATLLTRFTQQARAALGERVTAFDPVSLERVALLTRGFMARGMDAGSARRLAYAAIERQLSGQASVIGFGKVYVLSGFILLATMPLLFLVRRATPAAKVAVHAE